MARSVDNPLALAVLGLLVERPMHPYEMGVVLRERGTSVRTNRGSLYDVVAALEGQGWVSARETVRDGRRPARTVYELTTAGRDAFTERLDELIRVPRREYPVFLTAVAYLGALGPDRATAALTERAGHLRAELAQLDEGLAGTTAPRLFVIEAEYARALVQAELTWVDEVVARIADGTLSWPDNEESGN
ncbi:helix-turn-helix transcriptional regulator [Streptoalloteichus hindustanus]|uniref:DNA-binding transcriptional regulator, PadR family n=1 Tax=Streptoalloteichus hindustanus TaxID=2017 RepID=A0A1M5P3M7_STRHI|nr:helix-turn-helix transcriptional regulator [Streptoalloteichus hindustanus]SHG95783.1 DNA-binding transcriptional regulator, PadR family [Streptoalloteichus hindustanus]